MSEMHETQEDFDFDGPGEPTLRAAFAQFHSENPHVYEMFERFALAAFASGRRRLSARLIWYRMRWYTDIETNGEPFELNNNHTPYYARMFLAQHPECEGFFELRRVKGPA